MSFSVLLLGANKFKKRSVGMDEERPDEDKDFEERLRKVEENMRRKWPPNRDSQIAALVDCLRQMRGPEWDD
jgi:hypothetical protein